MVTFELTEKQREQRDAAASSARHILAYGGSRSGKTFGFTYCTATRALMAPASRHLIARLHNVDVRQSIMMDTFPTMMKKAYPGVKYDTNKSDQFVRFPNESEIWFGGLDDKERVEKILGKEYATIYPNEVSQIAYETILILRTRLAQGVTKVDGRPLPLKMYYDLNPVGRGHWTYKEFVEGIRPENGQPMPEGQRAFVIMNPSDNISNLPPEYLEELAAMPERQRQRFLEGNYLSEVPGTLWPLAIFEKHRVSRETMPTIVRTVIAVDPSGSDGAGGDRQGIIVVGLGDDGRAYVLADASVRLPPNGWAALISRLYDQYDVDCIIAEVNYGGAMVESTIRTALPKARIKVTNASKGKHIRAEPVAALYEQGQVSHVGRFPELEEQLGMFTTNGYLGGDSPDRADALVWGVSALLVSNARKYGMMGVVG